jgi:hypothetical protein
MVDFNLRYFNGMDANTGANYACFQNSNGVITHIAFYVDGVSVKNNSSVRYYYR